MVALTWNKPFDVKFDAGIDRGVVYPKDSPGVAWRGLTNLEEDYEGGERESIVLDSIKAMEYVAERSFSANVTAFSIPRELDHCLGNKELAPGIILTRQASEQFGFSYRHKTSEDSYRIHLVYNVLAKMTGSGHTTTGSDTSLTQKSLRLTATPLEYPLMRPTAHFIADSRVMDPRALVILESYLYGEDGFDPILPPPVQLVDMMSYGINHLRHIVPQPSGIALLTTEPDTDPYDFMQSSTQGLFYGLPTNSLVQSNDDPTGLYRLEA